MTDWICKNVCRVEYPDHLEPDRYRHRTIYTPLDKNSKALLDFLFRRTDYHHRLPSTNFIPQANPRDTNHAHTNSFGSRTSLFRR